MNQINNKTNVLVVADGHYYVTPNGTVYADSVYDYNFYKRYLQSFDHVYAVVRATKVEYAPNGKKKSSGEGITFLFLPNYQGPYEYIKKYFLIRRVVQGICNRKEIDCAVFRIPAATSNILCKYFKKTTKPYAVEVVTDPWENFGPRTSGNKLMLWAVRRIWTRFVKITCATADGASYVTEKYLQDNYPPQKYLNSRNDKCFTASYSSVELPDDSFAETRTWDESKNEYVISHVSNYFYGNEKGHITLMNSVKEVNEKGYNVKIIFVGDGPKRKDFEKYAEKIGISNKVEFKGRLANGLDVRKAIHESDVFILPTYAEGLPRVLLEAMAEGIPCLSSPICGIPEILDKEFLYDFEDYHGFANGIINFIDNPEKMNEASKMNLSRSKEFSTSKLNLKRKKFYDDLKRIALVNKENGEV